jgi:release factor glutamine methyltransferase
MLTVLESVKLSADFLEKKGIESPRLNAELLLAEIMNCKRLDLYLKFDQPLKETEIIKYRDWISRRGKFEPLQYIIGKVEFYNLLFNVTPDVLIPRPETEILIETIVNRFQGKENLKILDIGVGSGNISVALAKNLSGCEITGIDVSEKAVLVAKENIIANECDSKIKLENIGIENYSANGFLFDIVVSNPPYVSKSEFITLQKEIVEYEPSIAVTDSSDGLYFFRTIADISKDILKKEGCLFMEIGKGQHDVVRNILVENCFNNVHFVNDLQEIERIAVGEMS